jgi:hypothetical protein
MKFLRSFYSQLLFLFMGILIGFFITRLPIQFDPTISWISLATFFLTIILALYLEFRVRPSLTNTRNEKDILITEIKEIKAKVHGINDLYTAIRGQNPLEPEKKSELLGKIRELANQIQLVRQTDEYCKTFRHSHISERLIAVYITYKKSLTSRRFDEANFSFDRVYWSSQEQAFRKMMEISMQCIIDINKSR